MSKRAYIAVFLLPLLLIIAGLPALGPVGAAPAAPGDLDPSFGSGGRVTTDVAAGDFDEVHALLTQPDGKIVAVGEGAPYDQQSLVAVRYNADGSLDTGFGNGGAQTIFLQNSYHDGALAGALQSDGKIIMAGYAGEVIGGKPTFVAGPPRAGAGSAAPRQGRATGPQPANPNSYSDIIVVRLNADGSLDTGFGSGGGVIANIADHAVDEADGVAVQPDGKIVVARHDAGEYLQRGLRHNPPEPRR